MKAKAEKERKERELLDNQEKCIEDIKVRVEKATEKLASTNLTDVQDNRVFAVNKQKTVNEIQDEINSLKKSLDKIINKQFMSQQGMFDVVPLDKIQKTWNETDASLDKLQESLDKTKSDVQQQETMQRPILNEKSKTKSEEEVDTEDDSIIQRQTLVQQRIEKEMKETERRRKEVEERQRQRKSLQVQLDAAAKIAEDAKEDLPLSSSNNNVVVMRNKKPAQSASDASIPSYQRHSMAEDQMDADGYSRYQSSSDQQSPRRKTLHESGFKTADQLMQQMSEDERRRKASYNILKNRMTDNAQKSEFLQSIVVNTTKLDAGYVPSRNQRNEPVYYGHDSKTRLLHSQSARTVNTDEELKDEALAIRLAADIASKKALDEIKSPTGTGSSSSSSRQRIREILQKQREDHEKRSEENKYAVEEKVKSAFDPTNRKLLWVFR